MGFPSGSVVKNLPTVQETQVQSLGQEDPLEEGVATYSSILAWRFPWTEELGGCTESDTTEVTWHTCVHTGLREKGLSPSGACRVSQFSRMPRRPDA